VLNILFSINISGKHIKRHIDIEIDDFFDFFFNMEGFDDDILREKSKQLVNIYSEDLEPDLENEIIQFKTIMNYFPENEKLSMHSFLVAFTASKLNDSFPIVEIVLKLFVSIPCSNASGERFFSVLKRDMNYQRTYYNYLMKICHRWL
jgi:hypothetical protein